jgi:molybdate transport system substrate-binding protein
LAAAGVPVGQYARTSICKMNADAATFGNDFAAKVSANIVSEENDVKAVLAKVQTGEADAGIVYTTDITPSAAQDVTQIAIPVAVNVIANYPIAAVKGGNQELANAFIAYLLGPGGQATLKSFGFEPAP